MILHHYTDANGLLGILEYGSFWATQANFMNDSKELLHGTEIIKEVLEEYIQCEKYHAYISMLKNLQKDFDYTRRLTAPTLKVSAPQAKEPI